MRLAVDATRALERAAALGVDHMFLKTIAERLELLKRGELPRHPQKVLRHHVNWVRDDLDAVERKRQRATGTD